jgi:hypothetical protein
MQHLKRIIHTASALLAPAGSSSGIDPSAP